MIEREVEALKRSRESVVEESLAFGNGGQGGFGEG